MYPVRIMRRLWKVIEENLPNRVKIEQTKNVKCLISKKLATVFWHFVKESLNKNTIKTILKFKL